MLYTVETQRVKIPTIRPTATLDLFDEPGLHPVAEEVERVMVESMDEAAT